jgi:hypothetical protein
MSPLPRLLPSPCKSRRWAPKATRALGAWAAGLLACCLVVLPIGGAAALDYPTRPVRWVVGFSAGGSTDIIARILSAWLQERLAQPFLIEDKPGAGSNIALFSKNIVHVFLFAVPSVVQLLRYARA